MISYQSFTDFLEASAILGITDELTQRVKEALANLAGPQTSKDGGIMEWDEEYKEFEVNHRHYSNLYGLFPADEITPERTPQLFEAARKSVEMRQFKGSQWQGWSRAWLLNLYARLNNSDSAYSTI